MPAGSTYTPIATTTLASTATEYTFTSIPSTYTDLVLVVAGQTASTGSSALRVGNGSIDTGSNYSYTNLKGNGTTATSARASSITLGYIGEFYNSQTVTIVNIMNYANTTTFKTFISRSNNAGNAVSTWVSLWRSTAAINQVRFLSGDTMQVGTTLTLYGIASA
jgi:hypothetical protein